jgi:hypothetical protein
MSLDQTCSTFYVVRANAAKFGLQAGKIQFNKRNED